MTPSLWQEGRGVIIKRAVKSIEWTGWSWESIQITP